jgi:hypothetical protein
MQCPRCDQQLIWGNDFDAEDIGYDVGGIVTYYSCQCGVQVEIFVPFEREDETS